MALFKDLPRPSLKAFLFGPGRVEQIRGLNDEVHTLREKVAALESPGALDQRSQAILATKDAEIKSLKQTVTMLESAASMREPILADIVAAKNAEIDQLNAQIDELKENSVSVGRMAAEMVAAQGVKVADLPRLSSEGEGASQLQRLRKKIESEEDPRKRAALVREARVLRGHGDLFDEPQPPQPPQPPRVTRPNGPE